jgi:hypothetical protein
MEKALFGDDNIVKENGNVCLMTYEDAVGYCKEHGGRMPTPREFAEFVNPKGDGILESEYVDKVFGGKTPEGFLKVECQNEDGKVETFYFAKAMFRPMTGELGKHAYWAWSRVVGYPGYAHVFYGATGSGGADTQEEVDNHRFDKPHAVILIKES